MDWFREHDPVVYEKGVKVITSTVPMKAKLFANVKTTNYLPNALTVVEAESKGWIRSSGTLILCFRCFHGNLGRRRWICR